jgi:hypothetical protein
MRTKVVAIMATTAVEEVGMVRGLALLFLAVLPSLFRTAVLPICQPMLATTACESRTGMAALPEPSSVTL